MDNIGTDINKEWTFNEHGDLRLVSDEQNILQTITNRLTCWLNDMNMFYLDYGSILTSLIGRPKNDETLEFIKLEVLNCLEKDPRLTNINITTTYDDDTGVIIELVLDLDGQDMSLSLVIGSDGRLSIVEEEMIL